MTPKIPKSQNLKSKPGCAPWFRGSRTLPANPAPSKGWKFTARDSPPGNPSAVASGVGKSGLEFGFRGFFAGTATAGELVLGSVRDDPAPRKSSSCSLPGTAAAASFILLSLPLCASLGCSDPGIPSGLHLGVKEPWEISGAGAGRRSSSQSPVWHQNRTGIQGEGLRGMLVLQRGVPEFLMGYGTRNFISKTGVKAHPFSPLTWEKSLPSTGKPPVLGKVGAGPQIQVIK